MDDIEAIMPDILLRFRIANQDLDDVWLEGYEMGDQAKASALNPYSENTKEYEYWLDGWWAGFYQEDTLFETICCEQIRDEVVGDVTAICANDNYLEEKKTTSIGQVVFQLIFALFGGMMVYTVYDFAT